MEDPLSPKALFSSENLWNTALSNFQIDRLVKALKIPHYRGTISRDEISKYKIQPKENFIINIEPSNGPNGGTHWIACIKDGKNIYYFNSYGNTPVQNVIDRYKNFEIVSNDFQIQKIDGSVFCGMISLYVLYRYWKTKDFYKVILELKDDFQSLDSQG